MRKKRIAIWGSTGSIGESAIKVVRALGADSDIELVALAANSNVSRLAEQAREFSCRMVSIAKASKREELVALLPSSCKVLSGPDGLLELAASDDIDLILCATVGTAALLPTMEAIRHGKTIALANKEVMVMAGQLVMTLAERFGTKILPVDSEHSAIFQCIGSHSPSEIGKIILTASGGPFRKTIPEDMRRITWQDASKHPTWAMGPKVTLDSATLMNKALEIIEAHFLFRMPPEKIDVLIHPQSIVHSMVEFSDGSVLAQMSCPDMRFPILHSFTWPDRIKIDLPNLNLARIGQLTFEEPDRQRFPSLDFAYHAIKTGGTMPCVLNAANEIAVQRFRKGEITFPDIWKIIEKTMNWHTPLEEPELDAILNADTDARKFARTVEL